MKKMKFEHNDKTVVRHVDRHYSRVQRATENKFLDANHYFYNHHLFAPLRSLNTNPMSIQCVRHTYLAVISMLSLNFLLVLYDSSKK